MVVTVFPSPNGVGLTDVTRIRFPCGSSSLFLIPDQVTLATPLPSRFTSSIGMLSFHAISSMGSIAASLAISKSLCMGLARKGWLLERSLNSGTQAFIPCLQ